MRIGVLVMPTDPWLQAVDTVKRLEVLGYHHVWIYDHLSWQRYRDRPWHATYPWLTGLAAHTKRIRLGTMVSNLNLRHPLTLAKDAMTVDHISGGRFILGLGAGGIGFDATVLGQPKLTPAQRVERLSEATALIDGLLTGKIHDHTGRFYQISGARLLPGCIQQPRLPLAIAAGRPQSLRVAAEYGDAWITYGDTTYRDSSADGTERIVAQQSKQLDDHCAAIGRDPTELDRIYLIGNTAARPLSGLSAFENLLARYSDLGFTDVVFHMPRLDDPVWTEPPEIVEQIAEAFLRG